MARRSKRTDPHRPGAIVPAEYRQQVAYSLPTTDDGVPVPAIRVDCATPYHLHDDEGRFVRVVQPTCPDNGLCCVASAERAARSRGCAIFGSRGKCGVCGACFVYGSLHLHQPSGELVHLGHDCADKYELMRDQSAWELENRRTRDAAATQIRRAQNDARRRAFLDAHPDVEQAFELVRPDPDDAAERTGAERILADLRRKFVTYCSMSDKQVALAVKLAAEISTPRPPRAEERSCEAPTGRTEFEGEVVSTRVHHNDMGWYARSTVRMTVKITTDAGVWLAWGTAPAALLDHGAAALRGRRVRLRATLERPSPRDPSQCEPDEERREVERRNAARNFVFMRRPSGRFADLFDHPRQRKQRRKDDAAAEPPPAQEETPW